MILQDEQNVFRRVTRFRHRLNSGEVYIPFDDTALISAMMSYWAAVTPSFNFADSVVDALLPTLTGAFGSALTLGSTPFGAIPIVAALTAAGRRDAYDSAEGHPSLLAVLSRPDVGFFGAAAAYPYDAYPLGYSLQGTTSFVNRPTVPDVMGVNAWCPVIWSASQISSMFSLQAASGVKEGATRAVAPHVDLFVRNDTTNHDDMLATVRATGIAGFQTAFAIGPSLYLEAALRKALEHPLLRTPNDARQRKIDRQLEAPSQILLTNMLASLPMSPMLAEALAAHWVTVDRETSVGAVPVTIFPAWLMTLPQWATINPGVAMGLTLGAPGTPNEMGAVWADVAAAAWQLWIELRDQLQRRLLSTGQFADSVARAGTFYDKTFFKPVAPLQHKLLTTWIKANGSPRWTDGYLFSGDPIEDCGSGPVLFGSMYHTAWQKFNTRTFRQAPTLGGLGLGRAGGVQIVRRDMSDPLMPHAPMASPLTVYGQTAAGFTAAGYPIYPLDRNYLQEAPPTLDGLANMMGFTGVTQALRTAALVGEINANPGAWAALATAAGVNPGIVSFVRNAASVSQLLGRTFVSGWQLPEAGLSFHHTHEGKGWAAGTFITPVYDYELKLPNQPTLDVAPPWAPEVPAEFFVDQGIV